MGDPCDLAAMRAASDVLHEQGNVLHQYVIAGMLTRAANELESLRSSHTALLAVLEPADEASVVENLRNAADSYGGRGMHVIAKYLESRATALEAALRGRQGNE